jgi:hypothetical protein
LPGVGGAQLVEYLPEISVITDINMTHLAPESRLKLIVTTMAPGFGEINPDNVTEDPTVTELGDAVKVILVGGLVNVVKVVDVEVLVDVWVHAVTVVVVTVVDVLVELVVVKKVEVPVVVVIVVDVVDDAVAWIMTLVVWVVLVAVHTWPWVEVLTDVTDVVVRKVEISDVVVLVVEEVVVTAPSGRYASTWRLADTKICPSPALRELKCVGREPIVSWKNVCPLVRLSAKIDPSLTSTTHTALPAIMGGPARKLGPRQTTVNVGLGPRLTLSATTPLPHGTIK